MCLLMFGLPPQFIVLISPDHFVLMSSQSSCLCRFPTSDSPVSLFH